MEVPHRVNNPAMDVRCADLFTSNDLHIASPAASSLFVTTRSAFSDSTLDDTGAPTRAASSGHLLGLLVVGNLLLLSLFIGLSVLSLQWSLQSQLARTDVATTNLARTLQQSIGATIDKLDLTLRLAGQSHEDNLRRGLTDPRLVDLLLAKHQQQLVEGEGLRITDAQGLIRHGAGLPQTGPVSVADRSYFIQARDGVPGQLIVSEPLQSRISGRWVIVLARRMNHPDGRFAGVIYTALSSRHFEQLFAGVDIGSQGAVSLRTASMRLIARRTPQGDNTSAIGSAKVSDAFRQALAKAPQGGNYTAPTTLDSIERINRYERVGRYPLYVVVGLDTGEQLASWRLQRMHLAAYLLIVALAMLGGSALLYRSWRRDLQSQQAIVQAGKRSQALLRTSSDGVHVIDARGRIVEVSDSFGTMLGATREALLGTCLGQWDAGLSSKDLAALYTPIVPNRRSKFSSVHRRTDGSLMEVEVSAVGVMLDGEPLLFCASRDVTDRKAAAREHAARLVAEQRARALSERVSEREEFVRILAHEVRQPLNNASAALQGARAALSGNSSAHAGVAGTTDSPDAVDAVRRAQSVIGQIVASLNNTLAATALLASPDRIDCHDADVDTLIGLSLGDLDPQARHRVRIDRHSATRTASMDIGLVRLALRNLLGNALVYAPLESDVVLRISDSDDPLALVIEVIDSGPGIPPALRPHLFERGTRGDSGLPGHGLGLFIVQRVMALHGGWVDLRANTPQGAIFRLWLPQDG
jgi:PAS domain S-box-containing protein